MTGNIVDPPSIQALEYLAFLSIDASMTVKLLDTGLIQNRSISHSEASLAKHRTFVVRCDSGFIVAGASATLKHGTI